MMNVKNRYSRLIIQVPPFQTIKEEVDKKIEKLWSGSVLPEYVVTQDFEGYAISWRTWYGFEPESLGTVEAGRLRGFFDIDGKYSELIGEYPTYIEWIDEDRWRYIEDEDEIEKEVISNKYEVDEDNYFWCYPKFLRFHRTWELRDVELSELSPDFLDAHNDFHDKLWKACQRGIFNGAEKRKPLYKYLGFDYTLKP